MIRTEETIFRSLLDKPLGQLTEEDISQLTREDCRKYLKEKGMRRPSWNKSQAIEQVISLKTLLETRSESDAGDGFRPKIHVSRPENTPHVQVSSENTTSSELQKSGSVSEAVPYRRKDPLKPSFSGDFSCSVPVAEENTASLRNTSALTEFVGQMTIFYCGKVNVYDGMPGDKACTIMQLAASPVHLPPGSPTARTAAVQSFACRLQAAAIRPGFASPFSEFSPIVQNAVAGKLQQRREEGISHDVEPDSGTSRKASVQRYLEKRKDRGKFKSKRKIGASSSSSLEMYLNHQVKGQIQNDQSSRSSTCSPSQPRPPFTPIRCSSVENQEKNIGLSVDLNNDDVQEA